MKKALIASVIGQDMFYLVNLLLDKGYEVHGIKSHTALLNNAHASIYYSAEYLNHSHFFLHYADLTDAPAIARLVSEIQPDEVYNLGGLSHVQLPFETPEHNSEVGALNTLRILDAICAAGLKNKTRIYQTTNPATYMYDKYQPTARPQPSFIPINKLNSYEILTRYRGVHGLYACNGILFGCDLLRRDETLLLRQITQGAVRIACGLQGTLYLNSLSSRPDWGHAQDYAEAMWRVLQQPLPEDFVIATGLVTTVREVVRLVFSELGIDIVFQGEGAREVGCVAACHSLNFTLMPGQTVIAIDPIYYRSRTVEPPLAEASKARRQLRWKPRQDLRALAREMVHRDLQLIQPSNALTKADSQALQPLV